MTPLAKSKTDNDIIDPSMANTVFIQEMEEMEAIEALEPVVIPAEIALEPIVIPAEIVLEPVVKVLTFKQKEILKKQRTDTQVADCKRIFKEKFKVKGLSEIVNKKALSHIINKYDIYKKDIEVNNVIKDKECFYNPLSLLTKYNTRYSKKQSLDVIYHKSSIHTTQMGRWFAKDGVSLQGMPCAVRHTLCKDLYIDLDFVNCHPTILYQYCIKHEIDCNFLKAYVLFREKTYERIRKDSNNHYYTDSVIKKMIISALNGSLKEYTDIPWWKTSVIGEFGMIADKIASFLENKTLKDECILSKDENVSARVLNRVLCEIENNCLEHLYICLNKSNCFNYFCEIKQETLTICCLVFDGLMCVDNEANRLLLTPEYFESISNDMQEDIGYNLKILIKPFDKALNLPDDYLDEEDENDGDEINGGDDTKASHIVIKKYGKYYVKCDGILYINRENIWISDKNEVRDLLYKHIQDTKIMISNAKGDLSSYSCSYGNIDKCYKLILVNGFIEDPMFKLNSYLNSVNYLPYTDGIYSFEDKKLYSYEEKPNIHFFQKINRNCPKRVKKDIDELKKRVLEPIYTSPEELDHFLHIVARAMAGNIQDKKWYAGCGLRDCGKGMTTLLLKSSFGAFFGTFDSKCLIANKFGNPDVARALAWVVMVKDCRLIVSHEIDNEPDPSTKIAPRLNGNFIKSLASGGDDLKGRVLYGQIVSFIPQFSFVIYCNTFARVEPIDTLENLEMFSFKSKFVDKEDLIAGNNTFKLKDDNLKRFCVEERIIDAFTILVFDAFTIIRKKPPRCVVLSKELDQEDIKMPIERYIATHFINSTEKNDAFHTSTIHLLLTNADYKIEPNKVSQILNQLQIGKYNAQMTLDRVKGRGFQYLKYIEPVEEELREEVFDDNTINSNTAIIQTIANKKLSFVDDDEEEDER